MASVFCYGYPTKACVIRKTIREDAGRVRSLRNQIKDWMDQSVPPIVAVQTAFLDHWAVPTQHTIVVVGYDENNVYVNDPAFDKGPTPVLINGFLATWLEMDETAAVISLTD